MALVSAGCAGAPERDDDGAPDEARAIAAYAGFYGPESVTYDAGQDVWFVSNMLGPGSARDGKGYIVRISGDLAHAEMFVESGVAGAVLDAPKGIAIAGETLWVADIDVLRGFDRRTGAPRGIVDLRGRAVLLNDVAVAPDGALYVTDTGILMTPKGVIHVGGEKVFRIEPQRGDVRIVASGGALGRPNGVTWDATRDEWLVASFDPFRSQVYALEPVTGERRVIAEGSGNFDGLEVLEDGTILVSGWKDASLIAIHGGRRRAVVRNLHQPADFGVDTRRNRIAIPQVILGRVDFYDL